jgi:hypothetical protein
MVVCTELIIAAIMVDGVDVRERLETLLVLRELVVPF